MWGRQRAAHALGKGDGVQRGGMVSREHWVNVEVCQVASAMLVGGSTAPVRRSRVVHHNAPGVIPDRRAHGQCEGAEFEQNFLKSFQIKLKISKTNKCSPHVKLQIL